MFHSDIQAALAKERRNTMLAEAAAARLARQARQTRRHRRVPGSLEVLRWWRSVSGRLPGRQPRTAADGRRVVLRDGSHVLIRQVQGADAPPLTDGFGRLSAESRRMRFMMAKKELSPAELSHLTDVDHHDYEALGALGHGGTRSVGMARYIRYPGDPQAAEIAVTIVDDWQRRGLGTELVVQLSDRARQEGIHRFTALVAADDVAVAGLLRNVCASLVRRGFDTLEYEIALVSGEEQDRDRGALSPR
jgi:RimJ/RimL family protein N-acetyltransferase